MRKTIFTLALILIVNLTSAQTYIPMPLDSAYWRVNFWAVEAGCNCNVDYIYKTSGDTIIGSQTYTKIIHVGPYGCFCGYTSAILGALRQDSIARKVYIIQRDSLTEKILYDFTQNVGDTANSVLWPGQPTCPPAIISAVDSILIDGIYHRQIHIQPNGCTSMPVQFIEGVGSTQGLLEPLFSFEFGANLICVGHNGQTIFPDSSFNCSTILTSINDNISKPPIVSTVYPNPIINGSFDIQFDKIIKNGTVKIYDLLSREIETLQICNADKLLISNSSIKKGIFLVKIIVDNREVETYKIIAE